MKDKIGNVVRALVAVPQEYLGILLDLAIRLGGKDGAFWYQRLVAVSKEVMESVLVLFNPPEYFITCDNLWVSPEFTLRILSAHNEPTEKRGLEGVTHGDILKNMYDSEIIKEYFDGEEEARKHAFTPDQIAELIDKQKNGAEGEMLNNGYGNIFYVIGKGGVLFAVCVGWGRGRRSWYVFAYKLDEFGTWGAGRRIFRNKN